MRTVEAHLSHVYRKLGVARRAELARHLVSAEPNAKAAGHAPKVQ